MGQNLKKMKSIPSQSKHESVVKEKVAYHEKGHVCPVQYAENNQNKNKSVAAFALNTSWIC